MQKLKLASLFLVLSVRWLLSQALGTDETLIYYVQPDTPGLESLCPGHPCKTLSYYFDNAEEWINSQRQSSITMIFLRGVHIPRHSEGSVRLFSGPRLELVGEDLDIDNTIVCCMKIKLSNVLELHIQRLKLVDCQVWITPTGLSSIISYSNINVSSLLVENSLIKVIDIALVHIWNTSMELSTFIIQGSDISTNINVSTCTFRHGFVTIENTETFNVTMADCMLISNPLFVYNSKIVIAGNSTFTGNRQPALLSISSTVILSGTIHFFNNSAFRGGAISLYSSTIGFVSGADVRFINNSAKGVGGAIYAEPDLSQNFILWKLSFDRAECFYWLLNCHKGAHYNIYFVNNSAVSGGNDVYGASLQTYCRGPCQLNLPNGMPSVSSDPTRVCICDSSGLPQCRNESYNLINLHVHSGELVTLPAVVVGGDFGPTIGVAYAEFLASEQYVVPHLKSSQYSQLIGSSKQCTQLNYTLYSDFTQGKVVMYLVASNPGGEYTMPKSLKYCLEDDYCSRTVSVYLNISLLPCPLGFTLLGQPPQCDCYPEIADNGVECRIINGKDIFKWKGSLWIGVRGEGVTYSKQCPFDYCNRNSMKVISLRNESDTQCAFNRAGQLCGGCVEGYSLAIGSSHCIRCPNNHNLTLLILFAAAGFLLVLFVFAFNLTVTQGMINGFIFYANIVWTYHRIFFPSTDGNVAITILKTTTAWANLDFGIETCFVDGLTAFWKMWLQFVFPFYIWAIAGLIIVASKYSSRLTYLLGNRAVPVLNTLILLSYMKLLNAIVSTLEFSILVYSEYPMLSTTSVIWSVDGNLTYFGFPHILLFLAGLVILLFLWLPYTLFFLTMQCLRRATHLRLLKWVTRFHPVYDGYFAPLKHKHHYWFGVLLLVRGVLLMTFASTFSISGTINLLFLLVVATVLLLYITLVQPYRSKGVLLLQSTYLANLVLLSGFFFFTYTQPNGSTLQAAAIGLSTSLAFLQLCCIILYAVLARCCPRCGKNPEELEPQDEAIDYVGHYRSELENRGDNIAGAEDSNGDVKLQPLLPTY